LSDGQRHERRTDFDKKDTWTGRQIKTLVESDLGLTTPRQSRTFRQRLPRSSTSAPRCPSGRSGGGRRSSNRSGGKSALVEFGGTHARFFGKMKQKTFFNQTQLNKDNSDSGMLIFRLIVLRFLELIDMNLLLLIWTYYHYSGSIKNL